MKNLIKGARKREDKIVKGLIQYRNTPCVRDGLSPAQKLFGHPIQDDMPIHRRAFNQKNQQAFKHTEERNRRNIEKQADYYNVHAKELHPLRIGKPVAVYNPATQLWNTYGNVVERTGDRRYRIKTLAGTILCRNRRFLRERHPYSVYGRQGPAAPPVADQGAANQPAAAAPPAPVQQPEGAAAAPPQTPRRSARPKKKPRRLIEEA